MTFNQPSYWVMVQELMQLCAIHNIQVNSIKREAQGKEYDIALTWIEPRHDGSKCKKLPIEESVPFVAVGKGVGCVTDPVIIKEEVKVGSGYGECGTTLDAVSNQKEETDAWKVLESLTPKAKVGSGEIEEGDHVIYNGLIKELKGKKARIDKITNKCYVIRFLHNDEVMHAGKHLVTKVVY